MNNAAKMPNTVRIKMKKDNPNIKIKDVVNALYQIDKSCYKFIKGVSHINSVLNWYVSFEEDFDSTLLIGKKIKLANDEFEILDANYNYPFKHCTFKINWLPLTTDLNEVKDFIEKSLGKNQENRLETEYISRDKSEIELDGTDQPPIKVENGTIRIKVKFLKKSAINNIIGVTKLKSWRVLVTQVGKKPNCFICNSPDHLRKHCPKLKQKCSDCGKMGHEKCSFANKVVSDKVEELIELPFEDIDENDSNDELEKSTPTIMSLQKEIREEKTNGAGNSNSMLILGRSGTKYKRVASATSLNNSNNEQEQKKPNSGQNYDSESRNYD